MKIDIVTIFPRLFQALLAEGILGRAAASGRLDVGVSDLRDFTADRHRTIDDVPYGGGPGMVLKPEPFFHAIDRIHRARGVPDAVVLTSPQGRPFSHAEAVRLSGLRHIVILCGRYEGVDDRVCQALATAEISIGDYVLSGGELAAAVIVDAVARLIPGVVGATESVKRESFVRSLLDFPHFTRPAAWGDLKVPEVLLSGHHAAIQRWRKREAMRRTLERRPDLLAQASLDDEERDILDELLKERETGAKA